MAIKLVRYLPPIDPQFAQPRWGVVFGQYIAPLTGAFSTTGQLIRHGREQARYLTALHASLPLHDVKLLSPITRNQQFVCQRPSYAGHGSECRLGSAESPFNMFFNKASSCLAGPFDDVVRPDYTSHLESDIELGLVLGCDIDGPREISPDRLHEVLAGLTIVNNISAFSLPLPQGERRLVGSYRTFGPTGPYLLLLEPYEWERWPHLRMMLTVNGEAWQDTYCREIRPAPDRALTELSSLQDLFTGDLIAIGAPIERVSMAHESAGAPSRQHLRFDVSKRQDHVKQSQCHDGPSNQSDVLESSMRTDDGQLDLGVQRNRIVAIESLVKPSRALP